MRKTFRLAAGLALALATFCLQCTGAEDAWITLKRQADVLSTQRNFGSAAAYYEKALQALPPDHENDRADMQLSLATAYNGTLEIDRAVALLKSTHQIIRQLKAERTLDPQVLVSLRTLIDETDRGYRKSYTYAQRTTAKMRMTECINAICTDVYPQGNTAQRKLDYARSFIANEDLPGAEKQLQSLLKNPPTGDTNHSLYEWCLAAVQLRMSKPQLIEDLVKKDRKTQREPAILGRIANAQVWAGDYETARKNLNKALELLKHKPNRDDSELILSVQIDACLQTLDEKGAEYWMRKRLALFCEKDVEKYLRYKNSLAHCLRRQKRFEEADAVLPKRKKKGRSGALTEWEWFLTDKEKADVEKADAKELKRNLSQNEKRRAEASEVKKP